MGLQLVYQRFNGLSPNSYYQPRQADLNDAGALLFLGPQATVGFSITPRLALETGLGVSINNWRTKIQPSLIPEWWEWSKFQVRSTSWTVPLRVRYELGRTTTRRVGGYVLAGVQLVQQHARYRNEPTTAIPDPSENDWSIHRDVPLLLGAGMRYRLAGHWALTAEGQLTVSPRFLFDSPYQGADSALPGAGMALGLRYRL